MTANRKRWGVRSLRTHGLASVQPFLFLRGCFYAVWLIAYRPGLLPLGGLFLYVCAWLYLRGQLRRRRSVQIVGLLEAVHVVLLTIGLWQAPNVWPWLFASFLPLAFHMPWREALIGISVYSLSGLLLAFAGDGSDGAGLALFNWRSAAPGLLVLAGLAAGMWERHRLSELNLIEPRTGLYNREYVVARLRDACAGTGGLKPPFAVLMFDIDNFKQWNDRFGHQLGDWALAEAARTVRNNLRATDLAGRYGGEEFIILLAGTLEEAAVTVANRLIQALAEHDLPGLMPLTASIGVAVYGPGRETAEALIAAADQALYWAKAHGKNQVATFSHLSQLARDEVLASVSMAGHEGGHPAGFEARAKRA